MRWPSLLLLLLVACGVQSGPIRKQTRQSIDDCSDDSECSAGFVCVKGACTSPSSENMAIRPLEEHTSETLYHRLASIDFGDGRGESGSFELTVGVGQERQMIVEDALVAASLRARFSSGLKARIWGLRFHASGGDVILNATGKDPARRFLLRNINVQSEDEALFQLNDEGFPHTSGTAVLDLTVTAELGSDDGEALPMTATLADVAVRVEFDVREGFLVARLAIAETRMLFGVPDGLSVEAIAIASEVTGAEIPKEWL